jgi:hypothetical protein
MIIGSDQKLIFLSKTIKPGQSSHYLSLILSSLLRFTMVKAVVLGAAGQYTTSNIAPI